MLLNNIFVFPRKPAMDFEFKPVVSQAHPETMDLLSQAWCNFAIKDAFQPEFQDRSLVVHDFPIMKLDCEPKSPVLKMHNADTSPPPWKSNDVQSWLRMQQAMHPEVNYNSCFRKKWQSWKNVPFRLVSIKKWMKEIKQKKKEDQRLQRAEVHAAISVAGVAAALAAIAAENWKHDDPNDAKESAVASAAALVAAQCAKMAEEMGARRDQLSTAISSAMSGTSTSDILTLAAAASTSLRGAATLKTRTLGKNRLTGSTPVLPIEDINDNDLDLEKCRTILRKGAELSIETSDGRYTMRSVSVSLSNEAKVILKIRKLNLLNTFASKKECVVQDQYAELYKDSEAEDPNTCFLIVLTTNRGIIKLDMMDDYQQYTIWARTINHLLKHATPLSKYELQYYKD